MVEVLKNKISIDNFFLYIVPSFFLNRFRFKVKMFFFFLFY